MFRKLLVVSCLSRGWLRQVGIPIIASGLLVISPACFAAGIGDLAFKRGFGVRAAGMGGAHTAVADDGSAVFYNPAGLAEPGFTYTYGNPDSEEKNVTSSFEFAKLGYLGYGSWRVRDAAADESSTTAFGFGNRSGCLNWGLNYKDSGWTVSGTSNAGWSSDIGLLLRITPQLKLGILMQDILTSRDSLVPASGRFGLGFKPTDERLVLAGDIELYNASQSYGHLGVEANIAEGLSIRGGVDRAEPTAGLTLDLALFSFDYAALFSQAGQTIHRFEAGMKIFPKRARPFSIIKPKEYALIDVSGALRGGRSEFSLLGGLQPGLDSILSQIRKASKDSSLDGIMLKIGGFEGGLGGMAMAQEIRAELERIRQKGKKIVAYVEGSALGDEYYLAAVADKIVAPPGAAIGGLGKSLAVYRLSGLFDKLGIEWQLFARGKFKAAFDPYSPEMSKEQEKMVKGLVSDLYRSMLIDIARDRGMSLEEIKEIGDGMVFSAKEAERIGLIDGVGYYRDAKKLAAELLGEEKNEAKMVEPREVAPEEVFLSRVFGVAVIEIDGEIVSGSGGENAIFGGRYVGSETVAKYIRQASDDIFIKAILLRINSPGGSAVAAGEIYKTLEYAKEKKKAVIASIGDMGASGAYYVACAADKIVADPSSITGHIGVLGHLPVFSALLKKLNIKTEVIKEGAHADMFSGLRKLTPEEVSAMERLLEETYDEFVRAVAAGRKLPTAEVEEAAQGRVYTGSQALELKLVDKLGGFSDAIDVAREEAGISGEPRLVFYHEPSLFFQFGEGIKEVLGLNDWLP